jgi:regulator of sirC expression with transglutaminase-like and TPR domain
LVTSPLLGALLFAAGCGGWPEFDPHAGLQPRAGGLEDAPREVGEVLALPEAEIDLGHALLLLAAEMRPDLDLAGETARLDRLAADAARQIGRGGTVREAVEELNAMLLGRRAVGYYRARSGRDFDITEVIANRRGNCLNCTMLYLAVAERLGLEVRGVVGPGHVFMRYDDGARRFNIEPTLGGRQLSDVRYRAMLDVSEDALERGLFLRTLSTREFLAEVLAARGGYWARSGQPGRAARDLELALAVLPASSQALVNSGYLAWRTGRTGEALALYRRVLVLDPQSVTALNNLAGLLISDPEGAGYDPEEAARLAEAAVRHSRRATPDVRGAVLDTSARVAAARGRWREAARLAAEAARLVPEREDYHWRAKEYASRAEGAER